MTYIFAKIIYPPHKIDELAKKTIEITSKYPPDPSLGELIVNASRMTEKGIVSLFIYEAKEEKFIEALNRVGRVISEFRTIEGIKYSIETWATVIEAYATIGMTPPE